MKVSFHGAARTVTGSCFLVEAAGSKFLIDCGMFQGSPEISERNELPFPFSPAELDFVILTHAHIDHCGLLPRLHKEGFQGKIHCHDATKALCEVTLLDSAHIQEGKSRWLQSKGRRRGLRPRPPLYTTYDAQRCMEDFQGHEYGESFSPKNENIKVTLFDAGHILGSATISLEIEEEGKKLTTVFSGDVGNALAPIIGDPQSPARADYVIVESTYGGRQHGPPAKRRDELKKAVLGTVKRGGRLIIPSFAIGRTQELLYLLNSLVESGEVPRIPIFLDSPMAVKATSVFARHDECYDKEAKAHLAEGDLIFDFPGLQLIESREDSRALNHLRGPLVVISASGMCTAGRIQHHLKHHLWRSDTTVLFVGYQAAGTLGRRLLDGAKTVQIFGDRIRVRARIEDLGSFSAHADHDGVIAWLDKIDGVSKVFLVHGEEEALFALEDALVEKGESLPYVPSLGEVVELTSLESVSELRTAREVLSESDEPDVSAALANELAQFERSVEAAGDKLADLVAALEVWALEHDDKLEAVRGCAHILEGVVANLTSLGLEGVEGTERTITTLAKELSATSPAGSDEALAALDNVRSTLADASESADDLLEAL